MRTGRPRSQKYNKTREPGTIEPGAVIVARYRTTGAGSYPGNSAEIVGNSKKTSFVQQVVIELGLHNVSVHCARVEGWQPEEKFDGIISRAFAETAEFIRLTRHLLTRDGSWVAMKGAPKQELERLPADVRLEQIISLQVPGLNAARSLVLLKAS